MKKKIAITLFMISAIIIGLNAQNSYETTGKWEKTQGASVAIKVNASPDDAIKTLESVFKRDGFIGKRSGKTLKHERTVFMAISTDYINLYAKAELANKDKKNPVSIVYVFVSKGVSNDFISSANDKELIANLMNYLDQKYVAQIYNNFVNTKVAAKTKEIEDINKSISAAEKNIKKNTEDIGKYEKQIEKAKKDVEKSQKNVETQKELLKIKQKELSEIK